MSTMYTLCNMENGKAILFHNMSEMIDPESGEKLEMNHVPCESLPENLIDEKYLLKRINQQAKRENKEIAKIITHYIGTDDCGFAIEPSNHDDKKRHVFTKECLKSWRLEQAWFLEEDVFAIAQKELDQGFLLPANVVRGIC